MNASKDKPLKRDKPLKINIATLGGGGVGRSSLVLRLTSGNFVPEWDPTIDDYYVRFLY